MARLKYEHGLWRQRKFVCFFHFVGWWAIQLGFHLDVSGRNIEVHVPFGFFKLGWTWEPLDFYPKFSSGFEKHTWGWD